MSETHDAAARVQVDAVHTEAEALLDRIDLTLLTDLTPAVRETITQARTYWHGHLDTILKLKDSLQTAPL